MLFNHKLSFHLPHYFSKHPSRSLVELYWSVGLMSIGTSAVTLFEPIFLFSLGYPLHRIMLFYMMVYGLYTMLLPFGGRIIGRVGFEHAILYSQFFLIAYYVLLFGVSQSPALFYIAPFVFAVQKSLYWPAYHADFATFSSDSQRGREVGSMQTLGMLLSIVGPFIGGALVAWGGFAALFVVAASLFICSAVPLLKIKEIHSTAPFSYRQVFRQLVDREHRRGFFSYLGFGEELIVLVVWPIFIFTVIHDYLAIGSLVAVATLVTGLVTLLIGRISDRYSPQTILRFGTIFYFCSWIFRSVTKFGWQVLAFDTVSRVGKSTLVVPLESMTYGSARKLGTLEYTVFFEQSLAIAKLLAASLVLLLVSVTTTPPWSVIFIVAGFFSLLYMLYRERR
ncbi:MAG: MFS transporter [Patescibacteria group bacterium]